MSPPLSKAFFHFAGINIRNPTGEGSNQDMTYGKQLTYLIDATWATNHGEDGKRAHLGASGLGQECMRAVWFQFHWADKEMFEGRMLRLFQRGHKQEEIFAELLRGVGATVWTEDPRTGTQFRISEFGGHFGGSADGVAINLPDLPAPYLPGMPVLLEFKTHNDKSFKSLEKNGVQGSKPVHFKQAQLYMHKLELGLCLYMAVNKNDDALYLELFPYDAQVATQLLNRANTIIFGEGLPPRISESPSWFACKFCTFADVCFRRKEPDRNCRTCLYSKAEPDGSWRCELARPEIKDAPKVGCDKYEVSPVFS